MGNAQIHSVIQENYNRDIRKKSNEKNDTTSKGKSDSVIVIDSDSDGEKDNSANSLRHNHHYSSPSAEGNQFPDPQRLATSGSSPVAPLQRITPEGRSNLHGAHPPPGTKPPPLTIVSSASGRANRTTATVTPFSQSAANSITVTSGISANALAATRTSSFAAALRKLAKQANENDEISPQVSPGSSNRSPSSTPSNKTFHMGPSPLLAPTSTPPVVTITPTHSVNSRLTSVDSRRELDRYPVWRSKDSPTLQPRSRPMPHIPKPEDNRGFQPYRPGEDLRLSSDIRHPHLTYDPAAMAATMASYPIPPAFIPPTHLPHYAFRPEEQMERYGYLRQPFFPLTPPHLIPHPSLSLIPGLRYPSDLAMHVPHLPQGVSYGGLVSNASSAERERVLQDLRERERKIEEAREAEMQLHRERTSSLAEREDRHKPSEMRRSPPREPSHLSRIHPHSSRTASAQSSSSYDHQTPMALIKKSEHEDKWSHKNQQSHTSPLRHEIRHDDGHRSTPSHKDKLYQHNSLHESSRSEPEKPHIPRLFQPDRRHEREPAGQKEHSKVRPPPPLVSANHVSHDFPNHRTVEPLPSGIVSHKAHSSISSDEGQSFSVKKAKMNARIPSPLNLQLHPNKEKVGNHNKAIPPVMKTLEMEKPQKEFDYHLQEFYRIQSLRDGVQSRNQNLLDGVEKEEVVVSKIDLEAKRRREIRASGIYVSSESESDTDEEMEVKRERYRRKMIRIATKSKMPLDKAEAKVTFLGAIGLVTQHTKEDIVNERRRKRRNLLREESPSRSRKTWKPETPPPSLLPPPANITAKQFKKEPDYLKKCEFLNNCHLKTSSNDKKRELESARQYVEAYRAQKRRRLLEKAEMSSGDESKESSSGTDESLPPGTPLAVQCGAPTIPVHVPAQLYNSQSQHLPASHKAPAYTLNNHHLLQTVPPLQNGMVHSTSKALSSGGGDVVREQPSSKETTLQKSADVKKKKSSQFSIASFLDLSHSGKHVDAQSFAQEFHKSVLRTTQKSLANQKVGPADSSRRETFFGDQQNSCSSHSMFGNRHHPYPAVKPVSTTSASSSSFQWPGVDQISESYYRHRADQELERVILKDQLGRLQSNNVELRSKDEQFSLKMSELAESQQMQLKVQESVQEEIKQLRKCFEDVKKTISTLSL